MSLFNAAIFDRTHGTLALAHHNVGQFAEDLTNEFLTLWSKVIFVPQLEKEFTILVKLV